MIQWLIKPKLSEVAKYVECYWFLEKNAAVGGNDHPQLNADPSAHLILQASGQAYRYTVRNESSQGSGSHWLYPFCTTIELDHSKAFSCIGIKFKVGALYSLSHSLLNRSNTSLNTAEYANQIIGKVEAINFDSEYACIKVNVMDLIAIAKSAPNKCGQLLDERLTPWLSKSFEDSHSQLTRRALPLLTDTTINELGFILNCSQRTLERSFLRVTGLTLKQCQSMNKLEAILEFLYQRKQSDIDWVDLAYQFGFSDQPHLIRYLKKQIGLSPKDYAQQRGFAIDIYGGVQSN